MSEFHVILFETPEAAAQARSVLRKAEGLNIRETGIVRRDDEGALRIDHRGNLPLLQTLGGTAWGAVLGAVFLSPVAGAAVGAGVGALVGRERRRDLKEALADDMVPDLGPGEAALCLWLDAGDAETLDRALGGVGRVRTPGVAPELGARMRHAKY
ncbi:DUF1269 domain-containing protein [Cribrihabitans sp. XS_ASV171]